MCTISWCHQTADSYALFFNRDESKTRLPATPPRELSAKGVAFLSPADGDHGGTWLLANAHGLSVAVLNHYVAGESDSPSSPTSRGLLVLSLAAAESPDAVREIMRALDPTRFRPFLVFSLNPDTCGLWTWDGNHLAASQPTPPLTTSSYQSGPVTTYRKDAFARLGNHPTTQQLEQYQLSHDPARPEFSVRMRRNDAQTISHSRIDVDPSSVTFHYRPEPDESLNLETTESISIPRASA
jgi:hypothetical protein